MQKKSASKTDNELLLNNHKDIAYMGPTMEWNALRFDFQSILD